MPSWVLSILTVLGSGLAASVATVALNSLQSERVLRRAKLEELCSILFKRAREANRFLINLNVLMRVKDEAALEKVKAELNKEGPEYDRMEVLIAVYFPQLNEFKKSLPDDDLKERAAHSDPEIETLLKQVQGRVAEQEMIYAKALRLAPYASAYFTRLALRQFRKE